MIINRSIKHMKKKIVIHKKFKLFNSLLKHIYVEFNCWLTNVLMDSIKVDRYVWNCLDDNTLRRIQLIFFFLPKSNEYELNYIILTNSFHHYSMWSFTYTCMPNNLSSHMSVSAFLWVSRPLCGSWTSPT